MATERLIPCQHCGDAWVDEARIDDSEPAYKVFCTCGHAGSALEWWYKTKAEAIRAWNKIALKW